MSSKRNLKAFAQKWLEKFGDQDIGYLELVDHFMADDCETLGFKMDCGNAFEEKYGKGVYDSDELKKVIDSISDVDLLGSAIYSRWRYFNHWAYSGAEILEPQNREWFATALSRLAELSIEKPLLLQGKAKKIKIVSNKLCFGPMPEPNEEIEQRLTLADDGFVWFRGYNYAGNKKPKCLRKKQFKLSQELTDYIFSAFTQHFSEEFECELVTDIGSWNVIITNTEGCDFHFTGSLCCDFEVNCVDLSELIRDALDMDELFVFNGNNQPDAVNRIAIDYHRVTKIKPSVVVEGTTWKHATQEYSERLVLDRDSETIEQIKRVNADDFITSTCKAKDKVAKFLDRYDFDSLFSTIAGPPDDAIDNPLESMEYKITITSMRGEQRVVEGSFDKHGLPYEWAEFARDVRRHIQSYGVQDLLNAFLYEQTKRRTSDYIFCSVSFEECGKTYYYLTDDEEIEVGDTVMVPVGKDNHESIAWVEEIEYFSEEDAPFPIERTKWVIRKKLENV